jgi:threonyl-tRNA synthetase
LTSIAGAYWRGNEKNKMLTRVYGVTFPKQKMLDEYLVMLEEAKKRDHRKVGKEMELFAFSEAVGQGCRSGCQKEPSCVCSWKIS